MTPHFLIWSLGPKTGSLSTESVTKHIQGLKSHIIFVTARYACQNYEEIRYRDITLPHQTLQVSGATKSISTPTSVCNIDCHGLLYQYTTERRGFRKASGLVLVRSPLLTSRKWRELVSSARLVCRCHGVFLVEAAALCSIALRHAGAPIATHVSFFFCPKCFP